MLQSAYLGSVEPGQPVHPDATAPQISPTPVREPPRNRLAQWFAPILGSYRAGVGSNGPRPFGRAL